MTPLFQNTRNLHAIRGVAAFIVAVYHAKFIFWCGGREYLQKVGLHGIGDEILFAADMLTSCGRQCVVAFFILSAFVIRHSYSKHGYSMGKFYQLRVVRIYFPFLFSLVLSLLALWISVKINPGILGGHGREYNARLSAAYNEISVRNVLKTLVFIREGEYSGFNFAYWSLLHEMIFYILFPLYALIRRQYLVLVAAGLLSIKFMYPFQDIFYYQLYFVGGLALYDYFENVRRPLFKSKMIYYGAIPMVFVGVNIAVNTLPGYYADGIALILVFLVFDLLLNHAYSVPKFFLRLGDISYSLYLNHLPLYLVIYAVATRMFGQYVFYERYIYYLSSVIALGFGWLTYLLAEKPGLKYLQRLK